MIDTETIQEQPVEQEIAAEQQEVVDPTNQQPVEEQITQPTEQKSSKPAPSVETNMRALREKAERVARERDEMRARLEQYEALQKLEAIKNHQQQEEDLSVNLGADELAEGKHLTKVQKQTKKQYEQLANQQQQLQSLIVELKLKSEYPDIEKVVNEDTLAMLKEQEPEIAASLAANPDYYKKAKAAYKMIKNLGLYTEDNSAAERELVQKNAAKPRPLSSISPQTAESPLSRANAFAQGLTPELKRQLNKEMEDAIKNL